MVISARSLLCSAAFVLALCAGGVAVADEPVANLDAGGLALGQAAGIELHIEDLYLSARQVRVSYRFFNTTDQDVAVAVAFSLPDIVGEAGLDVDIPNAASPNFLNLQTKADGKTIDSPVAQQAFFTPAGGKETDITDLLNSLGIPLLPTGDATRAALGRLNPGDRRKLADSGYVGGEGSDVAALWTLRSTVRWQQAFPAKKEVVIEQSYTPSIGATPGIFFDKANLTGESLAQYQKKYCTNAGFLKAADLLAKRIAAARAKGGDLPPDLQAKQTYFGYAITRGVPIGRLRLVVDKAYPDNLVSFCGGGIKRLDGTRFELTQTNVTPDRNIDVLILDRHARQ